MIESLDVRSVTPYRDRPYEWVIAVANAVVDPTEQANERIADLDLVKRSPDGKIRFAFDVRILRPTESGNGRALLVVPNRGMLGGIPFSVDAAPSPGPTEDPDPGDGFLLERGWTIAWPGWQWDVLREHGWLGLEAPRAEVKPGWMRVEFRPDTELSEHPLSDSSPLFQFAGYPTADPDDPDAVLTVRMSSLGEKQPVSRSAWRFLGHDRFEIDGGFRPFHWYELVYRTKEAPVVGTGLLAVRDFGSWLRRSYDRVLAFGISQSGRFLRSFLFEGLNLDEGGRQVFDGVFTHITGARRGEFNFRYAQPGLTHPFTPSYGPPYDTAGLLARQRELGGVPKLIATNSSWEYWRGDGALLHQDAVDGSDLEEPSGTRTHMVAGTDHFGPFPLKAFLPVANPIHLLDPSPVLRALFVQLDEWVSGQNEASPSEVPRRSAGTAVAREAVLGRFRAGARPDPTFLPSTPAIDPESDSWPLVLGPALPALVSDVDRSGNEVAGIRLPAVSVPVWAYTGWNPRRPVEGLPDVLYEFCGSQLPLQSATPLPERGAYEERVRVAALGLVEARFLLLEDVGRVVSEAMRLYDEAATG